MRLNYCTLFDSGYMTRGLTLYYSLLRHTTNFHLYIFAFDDNCFNTLTALNLQFATIIPLKDLENTRLLKVKTERTWGEYCWTCSSSTILYCLKKFKLKNCTYLDADIFFFDDPRKLIKKMGSKSILITRHNYEPKYDKSVESGVYCVQFVTFKNSNDGMKVLNWWVNACIKWCFNRCENGKFGDQKFLDDWPSRFKGVYVLDDLGGGVAPWNACRFELTQKNNLYYVIEKNTMVKYKLNFFHFHSLQVYSWLGKLLFVTTKNLDYDIPGQFRALIYHDYYKKFTISHWILYRQNPEVNYKMAGITAFLKNYTQKYFGI